MAHDIVTRAALGSSDMVEKHLDQLESIATGIIVPILVVLLGANIISTRRFSKRTFSHVPDTV